MKLFGLSVQSKIIANNIVNAEMKQLNRANSLLQMNHDCQGNKTEQI